MNTGIPTLSSCYPTSVCARWKYDDLSCCSFTHNNSLLILWRPARDPNQLLFHLLISLFDLFLLIPRVRSFHKLSSVIGGVAFDPLAEVSLWSGSIQVPGLTGDEKDWRPSYRRCCLDLVDLSGRRFTIPNSAFRSFFFFFSAGAFSTVNTVIRTLKEYWGKEQRHSCWTHIHRDKCQG